MNRKLVDTWREIHGLLRAEWIADLQLGFAERRRHPILHTAGRHPQADQLSSLPHPLLAQKPQAEARRMRKRTVRGLDDTEDDRAGASGGGLERAQPVLRQIA